MKGKSYENLITAIDVGTSKICVLVAQVHQDRSLEIVAVGKSPSDGLKKGVVVDIDRTILSIKKAIQEAELMAGCSINSALVGISGSHVQSVTSQGIVPIKRTEVTHQDIKNVIDSAQAIPIEQGQQILHVLPQYYMVDSGNKISNPLGMYGVRLEVQVHIITGSVSCVQNLVKCCQQAGVEVTDIILEQVASAYAVLSSDERQLGVGIIDIGGGTSDVAIYQNNSIVYTMVLPVAGNHFTQDLALGLRVTVQDAERIKTQYGSVLLQQEPLELLVEDVQGEVHKTINQDMLANILHARAHELLSIINQQFIKHSFKSYMIAGVVLTGGGALLKGIDKLASSIFSLPVRVGVPQMQQLVFESLAHPMYATGCGLLLYAQEKKNKKEQPLDGPMLSRITYRMRSFVSDFFN